MEAIKKNLNIELHNAFDDKLTFALFESYDVEHLIFILKNKEILKPLMRQTLFKKRSPFDELHEYFSNSDKQGKFLNVYSYRDKSQLGRVHSKRNISLQTMVREIRQTLVQDIYDDLDITNTKPTILQFVCKKHNLKCNFVGEYVKNRDKIIEETANRHSIDLDEAKQIFFIIINGGESVIRDLKGEISDFLKNYINEVNTLISKIPKFYPQISQMEFDRIGKNHPNINAIILARLLDTLENNALNLMITFYKKNGNLKNNFVMLFDGILIPKHKNNKSLIPKCEKFISSNMDNIKLFLKTKEPTQKLF